MVDEHAALWHDATAPDNGAAPATAPLRARRHIGSPRAPKRFAGVRKRAGAREFAGIDKKALYDFPVPSARLLQECFNLTPAETRLAQFMARAESVEDAALALGVKPCTARSQLAAIFEKTGTARQAQLVALLSRLAHLSQSFADGAAS